MQLEVGEEQGLVPEEGVMVLERAVEQVQLE